MFVRRYATKFSLPKKSLSLKKPVKDVHPKFPVRTRFAPSPTGFLHMGSLRTALYNYLLAKNTGGQFLLRLEDTDQKRLVAGAEQNIYDSLRWCGLDFDEGPGREGPYGPYRQSDRTEIYAKYAQQLLDSGHAYKCYCTKDRLDSLRESAAKLVPPTTVSYDRHCLHHGGEGEYTIRLKSPAKYPPFTDLLHGNLDMQPQVNVLDVRYDDPILVKSDGLPTYHFANVVDDHLMKITHVIRGEEWLPSTPKHLALYEAFGWEPPAFVHIPLLTSTSDKKLSKRSGDIDVMRFKERGFLPEALVNFSVLFGWAPPRAETEIHSLPELEKLFDLNHLTKGNAKVDDKKLYFFNKHYLHEKIKSDLGAVVDEVMLLVNADRKYVEQVVSAVGTALTTVHDIKQFYYFFEKPHYDCEHARAFLRDHDITKVEQILNSGEAPDVPKKMIFESVRFALAGSEPGVKIPTLKKVLGEEECANRMKEALEYLKKC